MSIACFLIIPTGDVAQMYKRVAEGPCPISHAGHIALSDPIGTIPAALDEGGDCLCPDCVRADLIRKDARWPKACACGYLFQADDGWLRVHSALYRRADDDAAAPFPFLAAPIGAIWRADWYASRFAGQDGHCYVVMTPQGGWVIDLSRIEGTQRLGDAPHLTARAEIEVNGWRGRLIDGALYTKEEGYPDE